MGLTISRLQEQTCCFVLCCCIVWDQYSSGVLLQIKKIKARSTSFCFSVPCTLETTLNKIPFFFPLPSEFTMTNEEPLPKKVCVKLLVTSPFQVIMTA